MGWVRLDDRRALNSKLRRAGFAARGLDEACICQAAADETDGLITDDTLKLLAGAHENTIRQILPLVDKLLEVGRWTRDSRGLWIHDFLKYNSSKEELDAKRAADRERKSKGRSNQGRDNLGHITSTPIPSANGADSSPSPPGILGESAGPVPSRPVLLLQPPPPASSSTPTVEPGRPDEEEAPGCDEPWRSGDHRRMASQLHC